MEEPPIDVIEECVLARPVIVRATRSPVGHAGESGSIACAAATASSTSRRPEGRNPDGATTSAEGLMLGMIPEELFEEATISGIASGPDS